MKTRCWLMGSWWIALVLIAGGIGKSAADRIELRGGGEVRGEVDPDPDQPDRVLVLTRNGAKPIAFFKEQVLRVIPETTVLDDYLARRAGVGPTADDQFALGLWCEEQTLRDLARLHYEKAVELDKSFGEAHRKLGHTQLAGRWLNNQEAQEAMGMVRHKGKWIPQEEKDDLDARAAAAGDQVAWARRIKVHRQALLFGDEKERAQAQEQLGEIRDPAAVRPLVQLLSQDPGPIRAVMAQTLGAIPGPEANQALILLLLSEPDATVRQVALNELAGRWDPTTPLSLTHALQSSNPEVVGRAAWALASLGEVAAVPKLIAALVQVQTRIAYVPVVVPGSGGSFNSVSPGPAFFSGTNYGLALLTPPAVAPGAVAYGAVGVPFYSGVALGGGGGSYATPPRIVPQAQPVRSLYQNPEVLGALIKLTGRNFGYDLRAWRHWLATDFNPEPAPARQVPQP